ncbi:MAG: UpxY family transcription antiterminator [Flavobacteriaceae bacterium]
MKDKEPHWFAVYTSPRTEQKVAERLEKEGYEVYLPLVTTLRQWSDRKKKVKIPLINSYVFVRTTYKDLRGTLNVMGVVTILKYLKEPAIIKDHEINNMRVLLNQDDAESSFERFDSRDIKKGAPVEILNGPFKGLKAEYIQHQGKYSVALRTEALGSVLVVHVDQEFIKEI